MFMNHFPKGYLSSYAQFTLILDSSEQREAIQNQLKVKTFQP